MVGDDVGGILMAVLTTTQVLYFSLPFLPLEFLAQHIPEKWPSEVKYHLLITERLLEQLESALESTWLGDSAWNVSQECSVHKENAQRVKLSGAQREERSHGNIVTFLTVACFQKHYGRKFKEYPVDGSVLLYLK